MRCRALKSAPVDSGPKVRGAIRRPAGLPLLARCRFALSMTGVQWSGFACGSTDAWLAPATSGDQAGGNTCLSAHDFLHLRPGS